MTTFKNRVNDIHPFKVTGTELVPVNTDLKTALENEIAFHCRGKVTKRLALKLALAVISEEGGMFHADRFVRQLQLRLNYEAALRAIYLERKAK